MPRLIIHGFTISLKWCMVSMAVWLCSCGERISGVLPQGNLHHLENYYCWPYDVSVYSIDDLKLDSVFQRYPLDGCFSVGPEYGITRWANYAQIDTEVWNGMDSTLKACDGNAELYRFLSGGDPLYFAGAYRTMIVSDGRRKRVYERLLFLDVARGRLHVFKDVNKVF